MQHTQSEFKTYPPKVVGSITTLEDWTALAKIDAAEQCDWIEMRLDTFPLHTTAAELMECRPNIPLLMTARSMAEGGKRDMPEKERFALLETFIPYAHAIDIEIESLPHASALTAKAKEAGVLIIASAHDFEQTPSFDHLKNLEQTAREQGADIVKFAFRLNKAADIETGARLLQEAEGPLAVMGMGPIGSTSRLLYSQLGSCLIYGFLGNYEVAPGQWPAREFKHALTMLTPMA